MARDYISTEMGAYRDKLRYGGEPRTTQERPAFAQKSYAERAREAYERYLDSLSQY